MGILRTIGVVFWGMVAWLIVAGVLVLAYWPVVPETSRGWALFIAFGPPLYVLAEGASDWLWSSRVGRAVSEHPSPALRILVGVVWGSIVLAAGLLLWWRFGSF